MENENIERVLELAQDSSTGIFKTEENFHNEGLQNEDGFSLEMITPQFLDLVERVIELSCPKGFLCKECNENTNDCMNEKIMEDMMDFIKKYKRIPYSSLSSTIYRMEDSKFDVLSARADSLVLYAIDKHKDDLELQKIFFKFRDHIDLANEQMIINKDLERHEDMLLTDLTDRLKKDIKEQEDTLMAQIEKAKTEITALREKTEEGMRNTETRMGNTETRIDNKVDDLNKELIGIVSMFVAISFVMFGGMSLLNNLFDYSGMNSIPLLEMLCGGSLIGIIIIVVMYSFIVFMMRLLGKFKKEDKQPYKGVVIGSIAFLSIIMILTGTLWFLNIRNIDDVNRLNSKCKIVGENKKDKTVQLVCPLENEK